MGAEWRSSGKFQEHGVTLWRPGINTSGWQITLLIWEDSAVSEHLKNRVTRHYTELNGYNLFYNMLIYKNFKS